VPNTVQFNSHVFVVRLMSPLPLWFLFQSVRMFQFSLDYVRRISETKRLFLNFNSRSPSVI